MIQHAARVRVRYAETDAMGVVYYANYFVWFEVGRCELLRARGHAYRALESDGVMLPVIDARCEFRAPARYDDDLRIATVGTLLSPVRVEFRYSVTRAGDGATLASGRTLHAAVDRSGRPRRLPDSIQEVFE
jgi:acyl-CoA thioester hydrolase